MKKTKETKENEEKEDKKKRNILKAQDWVAWHTPVIPALGR
jgi:hypothetical protein